MALQKYFKHSENYNLKSYLHVLMNPELLEVHSTSYTIKNFSFPSNRVS